MWLLPVGIVLGVLAGELLQNIPLGIALGALTASLVTAAIRFIQARKKPKSEDDRKI